MYFDQSSYLPDDILCKVDRASMAVSLESREPLLDYRLVEFAWRLPLAMKVGGGQGKRVLRRVLYRYVPEALIERPKMGFGIPLGAWLRGPLREWAESLLDPAAIRAYGLLDPARPGHEVAEVARIVAEALDDVAREAAQFASLEVAAGQDAVQPAVAVLPQRLHAGIGERLLQRQEHGPLHPGDVRVDAAAVQEVAGEDLAAVGDRGALCDSVAG